MWFLKYWMVSPKNKFSMSGTCLSTDWSVLVPACRWTVIFHPNEKEQETKDQYEDTTSIFVMNNYFGIGIDAEISLDFHTAREEKPGKFQSR